MAERKIIDAISRAAKSGGIRLIKELVAQGDYLLSEKAYDLYSQGRFELEDFENSIECGVVSKIEVDEFKDSLGNKKYTIIGRDTCGYPFYSVGKIQKLAGARKYLVITAHEEGANYD